MGMSDGDAGYMGAYDPSYTSGDDTFADIHNLDHCIKYLNQSLVTFGFPSGLNLYSSEPGSIVRTCNCIYAMIQQRQRDIEYRETANETRQRLMSDMSRLEAKVERLTDQLASKERELQAITSKEQKAAATSRAQIERLQHEKDEFQRMVISTQQVKIQQMHELKKKEKDYIKLQERLNQVLMEKKKESKTGIEIMNLLQKEGRQRGTWNTKKADGDFYKMIVDAYETKKQELVAENSDLRALLRSMQGDMRDFLNTPSGLMRPGTGASSHELEPPPTPLGGRTDVFDLPFHMARDQIEHSLRAKMSTIKERMTQLQESQIGLNAGRETSEREQALEAQLVEARSIISEQASLMNKQTSDDDSRNVSAERVDSEDRASTAQDTNSGEHGNIIAGSNDPSSVGDDYILHRKTVPNGGLGSLRPHRVPLVPTGYHQ
ncbi:hypothetical protein M758_1G202000 [Ceratodon purpureus]|uniref:Uncharacterized protein n=1 Tax=Ceratodon purpureus TaxID=3225 RepID=A0A8T0JAP3_CERPU|nr:hypothetical protein KC19_1G218800 [Ceratodon purpureus]KAG0630758.1 hypothetical protein M758_1G202000 [Ceratodon purpureus]